MIIINDHPHSITTSTTNKHRISHEFHDQVPPSPSLFPSLNLTLLLFHTPFFYRLTTIQEIPAFNASHPNYIETKWVNGKFDISYGEVTATVDINHKVCAPQPSPPLPISLLSPGQ